MENLQAVCRESLLSPMPGKEAEKYGEIWIESEGKMSDEVKPLILNHGLLPILHLSCEDRVCHMTCDKGAAGFACLHISGRVQFYYPDGRLREPTFNPSLTIHYAGITSTQNPGRLIAWGPGAILSVLDAELKPVVHALEPMDVKICKVLEQSNELVSGGMGNICVWCLTNLVCHKRVVEGLGTHIVITCLALVPSRTSVLAAYGGAVVVVDLVKGCVVDHKKRLHIREITGLVYCPTGDNIVTASDTTIRVWGPDWELQMSFVGHTALITSLVLCPISGLLLSSSLDGTLRCWRLEVGDQVHVVSIPKGYLPPLAMGGPDSSGTYFSYSSNSVDLWTFNCLYNMHCRLDGATGEPLREISTPSCPPSFPACVLCIHGKSNVTLVRINTGEVLTRFQAKKNIRCADYCMPKDILLVLTEDGVVTILSTVTNPVTSLDEWHGIEQWDWPGRQEANIGKVHCMVLYSNIRDPQCALEEWKSLQMQKAHKPKKIKLNHVKNRFLVMLGHCGGCVSVLSLHSGKILYRVFAHNKQDITSIQAYPESGYLLTTGEDKALLVWSVSPSSQQSLSLYFSLCLELPPVRSVLLGARLILALQDPENDVYNLVQYSLENQRRSDLQPSDVYHNKITGLCAYHQLNVFASSSQDGTVRIWDKENRLIRILNLNAEAESLVYCQESGDLLVGIAGDLYRIPSMQLHSQRNEKGFSDSELSKFWIPTKNKCRKDSCDYIEDNTERLKETDLVALMARQRDLESLRNGEVECRRRKPATVQTKQEAFNSYMHLMYMKPPDIKIPEEDIFDLNAELFPPKRPELCPLTPPSFSQGFFPNPKLAKSLHSPGKERNGPLGFIPNSVVVGQLWPDIKVEKVIPNKKRWILRLDLGCDESKPDEVKILTNEEDEKEEEPDRCSPTPMSETPPEEEKIHPSPPVIKNVRYPFKPPKPLPPIQRPTTPPARPSSTPFPPSPTPVPPSSPKQPTPLPPQIPYSHLPDFLLQFVDEDWFLRMFPDLSCISSCPNPKDFCLNLLDFMIHCSVTQKQRILKALLLLIQQNVLSTESLSTALLVVLQNCIHTNMLREEQHFVGELLNLLVYVSPDSFDTIVELLAILADKTVDLQGLVLCVLQRFGLEDAELWLCPELEHWNTLTKDEPTLHQNLREMAAHWMSTWTRKYKRNIERILISKQVLDLLAAQQMQSGSVLLNSKGIKSVITPVDVLQYFCYVQRNKQARPPPPPVGRKDTVLVDSSLPRLKYIQRLGETYSMSRIREPQGVLLPPLQYRPQLMGFTRFLSLPTAYVTLSPFPLSLDFRHSKKPSPHKYFFLERSYVQYYR